MMKRWSKLSYCLIPDRHDPGKTREPFEGKHSKKAAFRRADATYNRPKEKKLDLSKPAPRKLERRQPGRKG